ncbi:methyltransferase family protein [Celeribacter marinus]|uniref:CzcN domain protein n=1 Tax=Celeribacter marinus TaxID=1397108 RepID=A0A0P0A7J2_9RHOB|nr:methyltransferase [Celeribacter marinus]ALI54369.1 CzcN domain protein [Celeribacter marinus]SFK36723.1 Phospholipid methyltransferase [Celeribacter marinus]
MSAAASPYAFDFALGLIGALGWIAVLTHAVRHPAARLWPPRQPSILTVIWSWGLTIVIYISLVRLGSSVGNTLDLSAFVRWGIGGTLAISGSLFHSWATSTLGLKATSGWPAARCTRGPYAFCAHPQYIGQGLSFAGLTLIAGAPHALIIAALGCLALAFAARVEATHLNAHHPTHT